MKATHLTLLFIFSVNLLIAQSTLIKQWDKRFGGISIDGLLAVKQTTDEGFIAAGYSYSCAGGDKTEDSVGFCDFWIVKTNASGNKEWDKTIGGSDLDFLHDIQQTTDGGYILGGYSLSGISGDKTQANVGSFDYWIVKTDLLGNKQWDKTFGGSDDDKLNSIQQTSDGGYILGGYSSSIANGDKSQPVWGNYDYWIVKTDSIGNKQWDKDFGGTGDDRLFSIRQTNDNGYILGGFSWSLIGGDKTQMTWGAYDYWIVKIDSLGNKQWDKDFGGSDSDWLFALQQTVDGGFILGGYSASGTSGNKTQATWGYHDYWIVKTDSLGNKMWDKDFGGTGDEFDYSSSISQTPDNGYLISGISYSPISGNKTENNLGPSQTWVVKTDSIGMKQWDKTLQTPSFNNDDATGLVILTTDGCYLMANSTDAGIGGDKTQSSAGTYDYWMILFCEADTTTSVSEFANSSFIELYPNPFISTVSIFIKNNISESNITIKNTLGQVVFMQHYNQLARTIPVTLDLGFLPDGIYMLEATAEEVRTTRKIVKQ